LSSRPPGSSRLAAAAGDTPTVGDDSPKEVVDYWLDNDNAQIAGSIIGVYAVVFFVWFAATLRTAFDRAGAGRESIAPRVSWGGALILAAGLGVALGLSFATADAADDIPRSALLPLATLTDDFWLPFPLGFSLFLLGAGFAGLSTLVIPKWLAIFAIVLGFISLTPVGFFGFFGFLGGILWSAVAGVILYTRGGAATPVPEAAPARPPG